MKDLADNEYLCVELEPKGYMIYNTKYATVVERSAEDISPYFNLDGNLIYCGPTYYYQNTVEDTIEHTVLNEQIDIVDENMVEICKTEYEAMSDFADVQILNYIQTGTTVLDDNAQITPMATTTYASVKNPSFFSNMQNCGYIDGGRCGYIAGAMILSYMDSYIDSNVLPAQYKVQWGSGAIVSTALSYYLSSIGSSLGIGYGTISTDLKNICREYFRIRGITNIDDSSLFTPFWTGLTVFNSLNDGYPVILFGNLYLPDRGSKGNHAVTVYKSMRTMHWYSGILGSFEHTAHFGWNTGYRSVVVTGIFGSIYRLYR